MLHSLKDKTLQMTYLVIDALDQCTYKLHSLLDLIVQESSVHRQINWIVSSRNWPEITERLDIATQVAPIPLELNDVSVSEAVNIFNQHKVDALAKDLPSFVAKLSRYFSMGSFVVCQNLDGTPSRHAINMLEAFPPGLNALYSRMIDQVRRSLDAELCKQILAIMSTVFRPITVSELSSLIEVPDDDCYEQEFLSEIIAVCGSFLTLREDTITFEAVNVFPKGIGDEHYMIFSRSLEVMFKALQHYIFKIKLPGLPAKDICKPSPNPLAAAEYACFYWVDHLQGSKRYRAPELSIYDKGRVDTFLQQKFLHWLEALSILGSVAQFSRTRKNRRNYSIKLEIPLSLYQYGQLDLAFNHHSILEGSDFEG
ncbi:hypothetical protein N7533_011702 [Penicillium manginii]|uniref:uncharacterized protein n=1 Tax=Penicillium manginii TaxID=203109 RepID=UPI0025471C03|nr:uncharacterized protein N7533_011702 [Penicillium manginii]KAJ5742293.1 hypothetical protein N7533_011702 [Penicillium manginii]